MYHRKIQKKYDCPIEVTREVIGGKWKPSLICYIDKGRQRPSELIKSIPDATKRVISQQLKELENHGIISKKIYAESPARVEYYLTPFGESLKPVLEAMEVWGADYKTEFEQIMDMAG